VNSIARRLSLSLAALLLLVGLLLMQGTLWLLEVELRRHLEASLQDDSLHVLAVMMRGPQGVMLDERRLGVGWQRPFSGQYFQVDWGDKRFRSRSLWDFELPEPSGNGETLQVIDGPRGQQLLLLCSEKHRLQHRIIIQVARDLAPTRRALQRFQWLSLAGGCAALLLILLCQRAIVRRALRPLEATRKQILQLQQGRRSALDLAVPAELLPLVEQINRLLIHTENTLRRSRNALGNLGHALKTPLAVLRNLASQQELPAALREKYSLQLSQIEQRISRELARARLSGEALPGAHFSLDSELPPLFATLRMLHGQRLKMDWQAPSGLCLPLDREDLLELLGNLLDNACKWAGQRVLLTIEQSAEAVTFTVDDDGVGVSAAQREAIIQRGNRLDEQTSGHGLGLAIVRDILGNWHGSLSLQDSPLGGLRVCAQIPCKLGEVD